MINGSEQTNQESETNKTDKHDSSEKKRNIFRIKSNKIMSDVHLLNV